MNDPVKKAAYKRKGKHSVYHSALMDFMADNTPGKRPKGKINISLFLKQPTLNERQKKSIKYLTRVKNISKAIYQKINDVSKATATRDLYDIEQLGKSVDNLIATTVKRKTAANIG